MMSQPPRTSFFSDIQNKFTQAFTPGSSNLSDYQGRYVGHLIHAISQHRPSVLEVLAGRHHAGATRCEPEYRYSADVNRIADLALFHEGAATPFALVEIKANDASNAEHNDSQLRDYLAWARQKGTTGRRVFVLTQFPLPSSTRKLLGQFPDLARELPLDRYAAALASRGELRDSELISMFLDYLRDKGLAMTPIQPADVSALHTFLAFSFLPHLAYQGRLTSTERVAGGPKVFAALVQNWQLLAGRVADSQRMAGGNQETRRSRPVVKFISNPLYAEGADLTENADVPQRFKKKQGGTWFIYARSVVDGVKSKGLYLEYGLELKISKGTRDDRSPSFTVSLYSEFTQAGKGFGFLRKPLARAQVDEIYESTAASLSNEATLLKHLGTLITRSCKRALDGPANQQASGGARESIGRLAPILASTV